MSGATRCSALGEELLALSVWYRGYNHRWSRSFHEMGPPLKHSKSFRFIEGLDGLRLNKEQEVDAFAHDLLLPPTAATRLAAQRTTAEVVAFATDLGAPGFRGWS